jgi:hypothetical protein
MSGVDNAPLEAVFRTLLGLGIAVRGSEFAKKHLEQGFDGFAVGPIDRLPFVHLGSPLLERFPN